MSDHVTVDPALDPGWIEFLVEVRKVILDEHGVEAHLATGSMVPKVVWPTLAPGQRLIHATFTSDNATPRPYVVLPISEEIATAIDLADAAAVNLIKHIAKVIVDTYEGALAEGPPA